MANATITYTVANAKNLPLRVDSEGVKETVPAYFQRMADNEMNLRNEQQRQRDFDALTVSQKDTAITAGKAG
jgi:hypothetical protein